MVLYVVVREDQNQHGFVDTTIEALFTTQIAADEYVAECVVDARAGGLRVEGHPGSDWEVYWKVE